MKLIPFIAAAFCIIPVSLAVAASKSNGARQQQERQEWVGRSLKEMQTIRPGMARGDLEKVFVGEGGLYSSTRQTYVYRGCPYFKVVVVFQLAESGLEMPSNPKDRILSITEPFVNAVSQPN